MAVTMILNQSKLLKGNKMKITKSQLREIIKEELLKETQWGGFTGGAAPLDPDPVD